MHYGSFIPIVLVYKVMQDFYHQQYVFDDDDAGLFFLLSPAALSKMEH